MSYEFTILSVPFIFAICCLLVLGYYLFKLRDERIAQALILWMIPFFIWSVAVIMRLSTSSVTAEVVWHKIRFIGPSFSAVGYLLLAAAYTGRDRWYRPEFVTGVALLPLLTNILVWTNEIHHLVGRPTPNPVAQPYVMTFELGPWFVIHGVYSYLLIAVGTYWLLRKFVELHRRGLYRIQVITILIAMVATMAVNVLYNIGVTALDWTPVGGAVSAIVLVIAMYQYRLIDVSPIAREIAVENMDSGMIVLDDKNRFVDMNSKAATLFDEDPDLVIGKSVSELDRTSGRVINQIISVDSSETVSVALDEETRHYDVTVSEITDATDEQIGDVIVFSDMSQEVQQSQELQAQKENLHRKNQRLEQFASVISHDIRNPLSIAQTYLDFARETQAADDFDAVAEAHDRIDSLLDEILTMARAETSVENPVSVQLAPLVEEAWETVATDEVVFENEFAEAAAINGDPALLRILFENLFRNAVIHTDQTSRIRVGSLEDGHGFYVADDGVGIPENPRESLFQYDQTNRSESIGIGLAIANELVIAHGWQMSETESEDGGGRFEVITTQS